MQTVFLPGCFFVFLLSSRLFPRTDLGTALSQCTSLDEGTLTRTPLVLSGSIPELWNRGGDPRQISLLSFYFFPTLSGPCGLPHPYYHAFFLLPPYPFLIPLFPGLSLQRPLPPLGCFFFDDVKPYLAFFLPNSPFP